MNREVNCYVVMAGEPAKVFLDKQKAREYADQYHGKVEISQLRVGVD